MSVAETLSEATNIIAKGWHQGYYHNADLTAFCSLGALDATRARVMRRSAERALEAVIAEQYPAYVRQCSSFCEEDHGGHVSITAWNDATDRTKEQVLAMFQKATAYAQEKGL